MLQTRFMTYLSALSLFLGGCSSTGANSLETTPSTDPATVSVPDHCTDPLHGNPIEVNARELAFCQAEALGKIAGYIQEDTVNGTLTARARVNIDPLAVEIQSFDTAGNQANRAVLVKGTTFVEQDDTWVEATVDSADETLAYQATMPMRFEALLNPNVRASGTSAELVYRVVGNEEIDGDAVTVLSLEVNSDTDNLVSKLYVRDDYLVVQSESTYSLNGVEQLRASTLTQIDVPQDITNPRFESDATHDASSSHE